MGNKNNSFWRSEGDHMLNKTRKLGNKLENKAE